MSFQFFTGHCVGDIVADRLVLLLLESEGRVTKRRAFTQFYLLLLFPVSPLPNLLLLQVPKGHEAIRSIIRLGDGQVLGRERLFDQTV